MVLLLPAVYFLITFFLLIKFLPKELYSSLLRLMPTFWLNLFCFVISSILLVLDISAWWTIQPPPHYVIAWSARNSIQLYISVATYCFFFVFFCILNSESGEIELNFYTFWIDKIISYVMVLIKTNVPALSKFLAFCQC